MLQRIPLEEAVMASILIVDDDPDVLDVLETILAGAGHKLVRAASGLDALDALDRIRLSTCC